MTDGRTYGQYCPIAVAAEIVARRWTPLVLRALFTGATRYSEIRESVPRMSTALLSSRLRELEHAQIITSRNRKSAHGSRYELTEAGRELFPVLEAMGYWSQKWLRHEITKPENLDPYLLMWEIRRNVRGAEPVESVRRVVRFQLEGVDPDKRLYWLVFEPGDVDICTRDPGHAVDLWIRAHIRDLVETWLGHRSIDAAILDGRLVLHGSTDEQNAFREWFSLSRFA